MSAVYVSRRAGALVIVAGLAVLAAWAAQHVVEDAVRPSGYLLGHARESYRYPADAVTWWLRVLAVELVIASWFVWRARRLSVTTAMLALGFVLACVPSGAVCVDAPRYVFDHLLFVALAAAWLLVAAAVSWAARAIVSLRSARARYPL